MRRRALQLIGPGQGDAGGHHLHALDLHEARQQSLEVIAGDRPPTLAIHAVGVVDQPPLGLGQQASDLLVNMPAAVIRPRAGRSQLRHPTPREGVEATSGSAKRPHHSWQPGLQLRCRAVEGEVEHRLLGLEPVQLLAEDGETALDQSLCVGERQLRLVGVLVAVGHDLVPPLLELVPEGPVASVCSPLFLVFGQLLRRGEHVETRPQPELLVDLCDLDVRLAETVVEAEGDDVPCQCPDLPTEPWFAAAARQPSSGRSFQARRERSQRFRHDSACNHITE